MTPSAGRVVALTGGIGGAKLALGLYRVVPPGRLTVVANTGDDFEHLGLLVSPDLDTLLYTLAGIDNPANGWGRRDETWTFMKALESLGGETWFKLGDGDLAIHVERTHRRRGGETLSEITDDFRRRLDISAELLPMSDEPVRTRLLTGAGWLDFQDYFVRRGCAPRVREIAFAGAPAASPHPAFLAALGDANLRAVVICPSNPFISIDPILALPGVREALRRCRAPVVAVSPIIGGQAVKGPTAKIMAELGLRVDAAAAARHYHDFLDCYVADATDAAQIADLGVPVTLTRSLMHTLAEREALAQAVLAAADQVC
jgi:LPPG:FO 2-phospho-L-lactate transferase